MFAAWLAQKIKPMFFEEKTLGHNSSKFSAPLGKNSKQHWLVFPKLYFFFQIVAHGGRVEELAGCGERKKKVLGATSHELRLGFLWGLSYQLPTTLRFGLLGLLLVKEIAKNSQPPSCELCSCTKNAESIYYHNLCTYVCIL